jgi:hypothetical protein
MPLSSVRRTALPWTDSGREPIFPQLFLATVSVRRLPRSSLVQIRSRGAAPADVNVTG